MPICPSGARRNEKRAFFKCTIIKNNIFYSDILRRFNSAMNFLQRLTAFESPFFYHPHRIRNNNG